MSAFAFANQQKDREIVGFEGVEGNWEDKEEVQYGTCKYGTFAGKSRMINNTSKE